MSRRGAKALPHPFLDRVMAMRGWETDTSLANFLGISSVLLSRIRHGTARITSDFILVLHEALDIEIRDLKAWAGMRCLDVIWVERGA